MWRLERSPVHSATLLQSVQENDKLKCKAKAFQETVSNRELETTGRMVEIEALQGENETLREVFSSLTSCPIVELLFVNSYIAPQERAKLI